MDIINFGNILLKNVENSLGEGVDIKLQEIVKNNGVVHNALTIREEGCNVSPSIYIDDFFNMYESGESFNSITEMVVRLYRDSRLGMDFDVDFFRSFDEVAEHLTFKLAMAQQNRDRLRNVPVKEFEDLVMIPICVLSIKGNEQGSIMITENHLDMWEISATELWDSIMENSARSFPVSVKCINEYIGMNMFDSPEFLENIYVVSTESGYHGAGAVLYPGVLEELADKAESDLFVIPASVHEMIVFPSVGCEIPPTYIRDMIREVNSTVVSREEVLSQSLYYYSEETRKLGIWTANG